MGPGGAQPNLSTAVGGDNAFSNEKSKKFMPFSEGVVGKKSSPNEKMYNAYI